MLPRAKSFGEQALGGLGQGIGSGLQALANQKLQMMQQAHQKEQVMPGLTQLFGAEKAQALAGMPTALLTPLIKNYVDQTATSAWNARHGLQTGGQDASQGAPIGQQDASQGQPDINAMSSTELASILQDAPKSVIESHKPLLEAKIAREKQESSLLGKYIPENEKYEAELEKTRKESTGKKIAYEQALIQSESGQMDHPAWVQVANSLNAPWLLTDSTQIYNKEINTEILNKLKGLGGKAMSQAVMKEIERSIASSTNTKEAREYMLKLGLEAEKLEDLEFDTADKLKAENDYKPIPSFRTRVAKKMKEEQAGIVKNLGNMARERIKKLSPEERVPFNERPGAGSLPFGRPPDVGYLGLREVAAINAGAKLPKGVLERIPPTAKWVDPETGKALRVINGEWVEE